MSTAESLCNLQEMASWDFYSCWVQTVATLKWVILKRALWPQNHSVFYVTDGNIMYLTDASRFLISCVIQHYAPVVGWRNRCIMLIMSLYPSWRQTLRLPLPGIEPGSPASQAGTLPKELSRQLIPVLRIWDFYPRSRILIFSHPGSWIHNSNKREG